MVLSSVELTIKANMIPHHCPHFPTTEPTVQFWKEKMVAKNTVVPFAEHLNSLSASLRTDFTDAETEVTSCILMPLEKPKVIRLLLSSLYWTIDPIDPLLDLPKQYLCSRLNKIHHASIISNFLISAHQGLQAGAWPV